MSTHQITDTQGVNEDGTITIASGVNAKEAATVDQLFTNPMTTTGDIIVGGASGVPTRKAIGGANTVIHGGTTPTYSAVVEADITLADNTTNNVSTSKHGFTPKLPNDATKYLNGVGAYSVPASGTPIATAGGTVNAQTGTYSPTITLATNTTLILNSVGLNTSPSPTATIDSNAAKTIVRIGDLPLMAGDTGPAGYPMVLIYNGTNLVLMNPYLESYDRTSIIVDENEFAEPSTNNGWSAYVSGVGAARASMTTFGKGNGWGWDGGTCGTVTAGRILMIKVPASNEYFQLGNGFTVLEYNSWTPKQSNNLPNGTDTYTDIIGWGDTVNSTNQNNGCYFSLGWNGSAVQWSTVTSAAGTRTTTTSSASIPSVAGDFFDFRIIVDASRANVYFYLRKNGGTWELANTHTTNIPANSTAGQVVPMYGCFKSAGLNGEFVWIDYYRAYIILTTPR